MKFAVTVDSEPALKAFRESRREIGRDIKAVMLDVGRTYALPLAQAEAPSILRTQVQVRATTRDLYLTSSGSGWKRARFWYLNNGGRIKKPLAVHQPAIPILAPGGQLLGFRMSVTHPRRFRGKRFLERTRDKVRPIVRHELEQRIPDAIQARLDKHDVFRDPRTLL